MVKSRSLHKVKDHDGLPKLTDFKLVEAEVDGKLEDGEILTEALCFSVDPYVRVYPYPLNQPVIGFQAAKVLESKNDKYPKGSIVLHHGGWQTVTKPKKELIWYRCDNVLPPKKPITVAVGAMGMPGMTAYFGFLEICQPKSGETVFVNGSAGAVGSLVGQIAKLKGCTVIGCCGSDSKVEFCKSIGFDVVFNYKTVKSWKDEIAKAAPNGIDCFFDNVGGQLASDIIYKMNTGGRIAVCGSISSYNESVRPQADILQPAIVGKQLKIQGFVVQQFVAKFPQGVKDMSTWIAEGKIVVKETVTEGFENIPKAFIGMLSGENTGKAVIKV